MEPWRSWLRKTHLAALACPDGRNVSGDGRLLGDHDEPPDRRLNISCALLRAAGPQPDRVLFASHPSHVRRRTITIQRALSPLCARASLRQTVVVGLGQFLVPLFTDARRRGLAQDIELYGAGRAGKCRAAQGDGHELLGHDTKNQMRRQRGHCHDRDRRGWWPRCADVDREELEHDVLRDNLRDLAAPCYGLTARCHLRLARRHLAGR